jgi:hypothetical protein
MLLLDTGLGIGAGGVQTLWDAHEAGAFRQSVGQPLDPVDARSAALSDPLHGFAVPELLDTAQAVTNHRVQVAG